MISVKPILQYSEFCPVPLVPFRLLQTEEAPLLLFREPDLPIQENIERTKLSRCGIPVSKKVRADFR